MKIRKLKIKNYKIFDDVEFDFTDAEGKTLDTIVLAGVNGCGKTTVLEVIKGMMMGKPVRAKNSKLPFQVEVHLNEEERRELPKLVERALPQYGAEEHLPSVIYSDYKGVFNPVFSALIFHEKTAMVYFPVKPGKKKDYPNFTATKVLHLDHQIDDMKKDVLAEIREEIFKKRDIPPAESISKQINNVTRIIAGLDLNTRLVDFESEELVFESANGQRIYFEQLSHGEQHLYFRAIYLSQLKLKDAIIMVDEPEAAFHPKWQQQITEIYQKIGENNQIFLATHSPHIMASVPPECLFMLHIDESEGKRKIRVVNAAKAGKHSQGLEPDRILKEIMQVPLREYQTQQDIDELTQLLTLEAFESERALELAEKLTDQLGREDPFIILLEHELLMLRRKKRTLALAEA